MRPWPTRPPLGRVHHRRVLPAPSSRTLSPFPTLSCAPEAAQADPLPGGLTLAHLRRRLRELRRLMSCKQRRSAGRACPRKHGRSGRWASAWANEGGRARYSCPVSAHTQVQGAQRQRLQGQRAHNGCPACDATFSSERQHSHLGLGDARVRRALEPAGDERKLIEAVADALGRARAEDGRPELLARLRRRF